MLLYVLALDPRRVPMLTDWPTFQKPITAISQLIERITREEYDEDDLSDLPQLLEAVRLQRSTGATEAARALRKKLKYGNPHRQLRALTILDDLMRNAGSAFQRSFADEPLLERLRALPMDPVADPDVKQKCSRLYRQWALQYKDTEGMRDIASLYQQLPQRKKAVNKENSKVLRETEQPHEDDEEDTTRPTHSRNTSASGPADPGRRRSSVAGTQHLSSFGILASPFHAEHHHSDGVGFFSSKRDKKPTTARAPFNLEKEKPVIKQVISSASIESTNLLNALMHINREKERVGDNPNVRKRFEACKQLRRQTYRYCSIVMDEAYLGTLLHANDQLSDVLVLYEQLDRGFDYDSDSEDHEEGGPQPPASPFGRGKSSSLMSDAERKFRKMSISDVPASSKPARPRAATATGVDGGRVRAKPYNEPGERPENEDENDPFADTNAV